jgi:hypothetical protein
MRLTAQHKRDIYVTVMEPFVRDIRIAYATLAHKIHDTNFVHKFFDAEKPDIDQHIAKIQEFEGVDTLSHCVKHQDIAVYTGDITRIFMGAHDLLPQHHRMRNYISDNSTQSLTYFAGGLECAKDSSPAGIGATRSAMHTGAVLKDWVAYLREPKNFERTIQMDARIPEEFKAKLLSVDLQRHYRASVYIPCIPSLWEKVGAGDEAANIWTALKVALTMHQTLFKVLQATTYKKLLETMPQLKSIIPAYIHAAEASEKERKRVPSPPATKEDIDVTSAAQALTLKRLQGQI